MKVLKGTPKYLSKTGSLDEFTYLMLNLPFKCNYLCSKCFNHEGGNPITSGNPIFLEDRLKLIRDAKKIGGKVVVIAGEGEPSLNKETRRLVSEINSNGMIPIVYSNGSTLTPKLIEFYKENNTTIVISFDSLDPKTYNKLTGTNRQFDRVLKNIRSLMEAYKDTIEKIEDLKIVRIAINTTITSLNEKELSKIKNFWGDNIYFICNPIVKLGNAIQNWDKLVLDKESHKKQKKLIKELSESGGPLTLGSDDLCGYSRWGIAIGPYGDYMTCAYTTETNGLLGNIRNTSLREAFNRKHKIESTHYKSHGNVPCLIRATSFNYYLNNL